MPRPNLSKIGKLSKAKLEALVSRAQSALERLRDQDLKVLVAEVRSKAKELGVEISDVVHHLSDVAHRRGRPAARVISTGGRGKKRSNKMKGKKIKPWFADSAGNTWTGRGNPARFIRDHFLAGGKLMDLLVDKSKAEEAKRIEAKLKAKFKTRSGTSKKAATRKKAKSTTK